MKGYLKGLLVALLVGLLPGAPMATTIYATAGGGGGGGVIKTTVGGLPTCNATTQGRVYSVTDATANTCTAGGSSHELCICDGSNWVIVGDGTAAPGAVAWTDVAAGTNTNTQLVGTGGSMNASGTGVIGATLLNNVDAAEPDLRHDDALECWYQDEDGSLARNTTSGNAAQREISVAEQCIGDNIYGVSTTLTTYRYHCNPAIFEASSDSDGIQECVDYLEDIGGGTIKLGPRAYELTGATPITFDAGSGREIIVQGAGAGSGFIRCSVANGCTAPAVFDIQAPAVTLRDLWIVADRDDVAPVDGIRIGERDDAECTAAGHPSTCCTGAGAGTCDEPAATYTSTTTLQNVYIDGDSDNDTAGAREATGIRHVGLRTLISRTRVRYFSQAIELSGNATGNGGGPATSNNVVITDNSELRESDVGLVVTTGSGTTGVVDAASLYVGGNLFETIHTYGAQIGGQNSNAAIHQPFTFVGNHFEAMDTAIKVVGLSGSDAADPNVASMNNLFTSLADSAGDADADSDAILSDSNTDNTIISINDFTNSTNCITHAGTGSVKVIGRNFNDNTCTPTAAAGVRSKTDSGLDYGTAFPTGVEAPQTGDVFIVTDDSAAGACDSAAGSATTLCWWTGSTWSALGGGGGSGDVTAVGPACSGGACWTDSVLTTGTELIVWEGTGADDANEYRINMPAANPTSDIAWTFPTTTGNLVGTGDTGSVTGTMILNDTVAVGDLAADLALVDGDSLDFSGITLSTTGEGLILTQPSDCNALTGVTAGTTCYDTTDDAFCVYDGTAMDCQILGAAGSGDVTDVGDCDGATCFTTAGDGTTLFTNSDFIIELDNNTDGSNTFQIQAGDGADTVVFQVDEAGVVTLPAGGSINIPINATDGQALTLFEDLDHAAGDHSWSIDVAQVDLTGDLTAAVQADGGVDFPGVLIAPGFYSDAADPADGGDIRLANAETICWEASPAGTDVCITTTSGELVDITGGTLNAADLDGAVPAAVTATTASSDDSDTSLATTAFVQQEINGAGGAGLACSSGSCATASSEASFLGSGTAAPTNDGAILLDTDGDGATITNDVVVVQNGSEDFIIPTVREYPTVNGQILKYNSANGDLEWATDADSGGAPALSSVTAPTAAWSLNFDAAETTDWNATGAFSADFFEFTQVTGNPTTGSVVAVNAEDASIPSILKVDNTGANTIAAGLEILGSSTGAVTVAVDADDAEIGAALAIGTNTITTGSTTIESTELDLLNGKDAALVDINDTSAGLTTLTGTALTLGDGGDFTALTVDAGATDPTFTFASDSVTVTNAATFNHVDGSIPTADLATEVRSMHWGAGAMSADATDCASPTEVSVTSGPKFYSIACAMASSETDGFIYGNTVLPDSINIAADVTFQVTARVVTDNAGATAHGYIEIQCVDADATVGSTWSSGTDLDVTQAAGDVADDLIQDISAAVDLAQGANPDCSASDVLFWRYKVCDTDATPSTGCTSSAGAENDHQYVSMKMEYTTDIGD